MIAPHFHPVQHADLLVAFNNNTLIGRTPQHRHLSDLRGLFIDTAAFEKILAEKNNPLLYSVSSVEPSQGDSQLHYGLGILHSGQIGDEYHFTKGHYHAHRPAAEIYLTLQGEGFMQLEDESTHETTLVPMRPQTILYVPGHTAHRTINTGSSSLSYIGIYPAIAGHDYAPIAKTNFQKALINQNGTPTLIDRPKT